MDDWARYNVPQCVPLIFFSVLSLFDASQADEKYQQSMIERVRECRPGGVKDQAGSQRCGESEWAQLRPSSYMRGMGSLCGGVASPFKTVTLPCPITSRSLIKTITKPHQIVVIADFLVLRSIGLDICSY